GRYAWSGHRRRTRAGSTRRGARGCRAGPSRRRTARDTRSGWRAHPGRRPRRRDASTLRIRGRRWHGSRARRRRATPDRGARGRRAPPGCGSSRPRSGGSCADLLDGVARADLDARQAGGAPFVDDLWSVGRDEQGPFGAGDDARTAGRAGGGHGDRHGRYPRGVTMRPPTTRVEEVPIRTQLVMPAEAGSMSVSVVTWICSSARDASVTTATGVAGG